MTLHSVTAAGSLFVALALALSMAAIVEAPTYLRHQVRALKVFAWFLALLLAVTVTTSIYAKGDPCGDTSDHTVHTTSEATRGSVSTVESYMSGQRILPTLAEE